MLKAKTQHFLEQYRDFLIYEYRFSTYFRICVNREIILVSGKILLMHTFSVYFGSL